MIVISLLIDFLIVSEVFDFFMFVWIYFGCNVIVMIFLLVRLMFKDFVIMFNVVLFGWYGYIVFYVLFVMELVLDDILIMKVLEELFLFFWDIEWWRRGKNVLVNINGVMMLVL